MITNKNDVKKFLDKLHDILNSAGFDIERNFILIQATKQGEDIRFSTPYTLMHLDYDAEDVVKVLKSLTVQDYSETLLDTGNADPPVLLVFCKELNKKEVYIKIKIRELLDNVICISFHYAKHSMNRPYL